MIRRIREVLRLQAEAVAALVDVAFLSGDGAVEKISRVELDAGLRGRDLQHATARGFVDARGQTEAVAFPVDHKVVIVAVAEDQLLVAVVDARADLRRRGEVERRALDRAKFAGRNKILVDRE